MNKLFSEEHKTQEHRLKLERWQGPPCVNKVEPYKLCSKKFSVATLSKRSEFFFVACLVVSFVSFTG